MPFLGVGGVLWPKLAIETPTTRRNFGKFRGWPLTRSDASHHRRYCLTTCWARYLQKGRSKFDRCGIRCGGLRESVGRADFHVGRHGSHQKGNPRSGVPLISVNIMISLLVISRIIFYRKHFWPPGSLFSDGGSTIFVEQPSKKPQFD